MEEITHSYLRNHQKRVKRIKNLDWCLSRRTMKDIRPLEATTLEPASTEETCSHLMTIIFCGCLKMASGSALFDCLKSSKDPVVL